MHLKPEYIVGLVDGEGSFAIHLRDLKKIVKRRAIVEPRFYLKLQHRDKPILMSLKRFFGCGNVYIQRDRRENHQLCYRYEVANRKDLAEKIAPFFKTHPLKLPSKKKDFLLFSKALALIMRKSYFTEAGKKKIQNLVSKMH
jgi:hypothetical protein